MTERVRIPAPDSIWGHLEPLNPILVEFSRRYELAFGYVHGKRDQPTDEQDTLVSTSGFSDPTYRDSMDNDQIWARKKLAELGREAIAAANKLHRLNNQLEFVFHPPWEEDTHLDLKHHATPIEKKSGSAKQAEKEAQKREMLKELMRLENRANVLRRQIG